MAGRGGRKKGRSFCGRIRHRITKDKGPDLAVKKKGVSLAFSRFHSDTTSQKREWTDPAKVTRGVSSPSSWEMLRQAVNGVIKVGDSLQLSPKRVK